MKTLRLIVLAGLIALAPAFVGCSGGGAVMSATGLFVQHVLPTRGAKQRGLLAQDVWLVTAVLALLGIGLVMVASASITIADRQLGASRQTA